MSKQDYILNISNIEEHETSQLIKERITDAVNHKEIIRILKDYEVVNPNDYLRSCGISNFTDFSYQKITNPIYEYQK